MGFEGVFGEDEESADVSTWRESEDVQGLDIEDFDAWDVSEGSDDTVVLGVDDCWSEFLDVLSVSRFTSAGSGSSGGVNSFDIIPSSHSFQQVNSLFGLFVFLASVADNTWYFWNFVDFVTFSHNESWDTGGSNGTGHSVSSLVDVALFVPPPRHILPKAAWPDRWVPPPRTRGIRATARPVPQDSAEVCSPAIFLTPVACRAFFRRLVWTKLTRSLRIGALKTAGVLTWPEALPASS